MPEISGQLQPRMGKCILSVQPMPVLAVLKYTELRGNPRDFRPDSACGLRRRLPSEKPTAARKAAASRRGKGGPSPKSG